MRDFPTSKLGLTLTRDNEDDTDRWDPFDGTGPSYGRPFLERLLLSLIDAHPNPRVKNLPERIRRDRGRRLSLAMKALCDGKPSQKLPDDAALLWIANQYAHDRAREANDVQLSQAAGPAPVSVRSDRQLAQEASEKFYPKITDKSERLRKKWEEQKERWLALALWHDHLPELFETQALARDLGCASKGKGARCAQLACRKRNVRGANAAHRIASVSRTGRASGDECKACIWIGRSSTSRARSGIRQSVEAMGVAAAG